jgi:hypothetical protein
MVSIQVAKPESQNPMVASRPTSSREQFFALLILCSLAFVVRLVFVWRLFHAAPLWQFWGSGVEPSSIADSLIKGLGFSSPFAVPSGPTAWVPPFYPYIEAVAFYFFGSFSVKAVWCLLLLNLCCATVTTAVLYRIGMRCFGSLAAFGGALIWALSPDTVAMPARLWDASLGTLLATLLVLWYLRLVQSPTRTRDWVLYGLLWGVAALTTTTILAMMPLAVAVLFLRDRGSARRQTMVAVATLIVVLLPWTVRNYRQFGKLVPIRGNYGAELWAGNHPGVQGPDDESAHPLKDKAELAAYLNMGEMRYVADCQKRAYRFIRENPKQFARLTGQRLIGFWTAPRMQTSAWPTGCGVLAWASLAMLLWRPQTRLLAVPFASAFLFFPCSYYISHAENCFRFPIEPLILLLAVNSLVVFIDSAGRPQVK